MNGQADVEVDYKRKYKNLKRKLKFLVYVSHILLILGASRQFYKCLSIYILIWSLVSGTGMFSGGAKKSSEKTSQSLQRQKVCVHANITTLIL